MGPELSEKDRNLVLGTADVVAGYENISCLIKSGPTDDSMIVFVRYDMRLSGIPTPVPGLSTFLVCRNEDGSLYIGDTSYLSYKQTQQIYSVASEQDVTSLMAEVDELYAERLNSDPH